jgi:hypothetical protein
MHIFLPIVEREREREREREIIYVKMAGWLEAFIYIYRQL